jgi:hypothetical protein
MQFNKIPRIPVGASAKRSGARINTSRTPPIYRPLLAIPLSRLIYETSLSAPPCPIEYPGYKLKIHYLPT